MTTKTDGQHTPTPCEHEVPDYDETCKKCERELLMFERITDRTNFAELIERPEWEGIKKKIVRAVNAYTKVEKVVSAIARKNGEEVTKYFLNAVNSHEALLEALIEAREVLESFGQRMPIITQRKINKAIAQAEGRP